MTLRKVERNIGAFRCVYLVDENNFAQGEYSEYDKNGVLREKGVFKDSMRNGEWFTYFKNGKVESLITYKNGIMNGKARTYNIDGSIKAKGVIKNNGLVRLVRYDLIDKWWLIKNVSSENLKYVKYLSVNKS